MLTFPIMISCDLNTEHHMAELSLAPTLFSFDWPKVFQYNLLLVDLKKPLLQISRMEYSILALWPMHDIVVITLT